MKPANSIVKELYMACKNGDFTRAVQIINAGGDPDIVIIIGLDNGPMLKFAAESGNIDLVKYLVEDCKVNIEARGGTSCGQDTALSRACRKGHYEVADYLLRKGANPNGKIPNSTVLVDAINSKKIALIRLLVDRGALIQSREIGVALNRGVYEVSEFLLSKMKNSNVSNYFSDEWVRLAVKGGCVKTMKLLIDRFQVDLFVKQPVAYKGRPDGYEIVLYAARGGSMEMMNYLVEECKFDLVRMVKQENSGNSYYKGAQPTILGNAIESNSLALIKYLAEPLALLPAADGLQKLKINAGKFSGIKVNAYLESYLIENSEKKNLLLQVAHEGLESLDLQGLLLLFQSKIPTRGTFYNFNSEIMAKIKEKVHSPEQMDILLQNHPQRVAKESALNSQSMFGIKFETCIEDESDLLFCRYK